MLSGSSEFFRAACSERWRKLKDKIIRFPEANAVAFSIYLNWRYLGAIDLWDGAPEDRTHVTKEGVTFPVAGCRHTRIVQSYILGDMLVDDKFCNALIDSYFELARETGHKARPDEVNLAFERLSQRSGLRFLLVHQEAFEAAYDNEGIEEKLDLLLPEVWREVAKESMKYRDLSLGEKKPSKRGKCFYHKHNGSQESCA